MDPPPSLKNASAAARERIQRNRERIARAEAESLGLSISPSSTQPSLPPSTTFGSIALSSSTSSGSGSGSGSGYPLLGLPDPLSPIGNIHPRQIPPTSQGFSSLGLSTSETPIQGFRFGTGTIEPSSVRERGSLKGIGLEDEFDFSNEILPSETLAPPTFVDEVNISRWSSTDAGSNAESVPKTGGRFKKWDPHAKRPPKEVPPPLNPTFELVKLDQVEKEKKKDEREGMMGRIFGRKVKGKGKEKEEVIKETVGRSGKLDWEEKLDAMEKAENDRALRPLQSSTSQPGPSRTPQQMGESSPYLPISQTTPSLVSNPFADPTRPSPAAQYTQLSSAPSQPLTPREEDKSLPPIPTPGRYHPGMTPRQVRQDISPLSHSGPLPMGWEELAVEPLGPPLPTSSSGSGLDSRRTNPLFANTVVKEVASPERPPRPRPSIPTPPTPSSGFITTVNAQPVLEAPIARERPGGLMSSLLASGPKTRTQNQETRYPSLSPRTGLLPSSFSLPSISPYLSLPPNGFDPTRRRPSDITVHATIPDPEDLITQNPRRRSMSMTEIDTSPRYIVDPKTRYVPRRRTRTGDSEESDFTTNSLSSLTRESLGMVGPSTDIVRRMSKMVTVPIYGVPSVNPTPTPGGLPPPPRRRQVQPQRQQQEKKEIPTIVEKEGFFTRHAAFFNLSLKPKQEDTYHEHFDSHDPVHPEISFFMNPYGPELHLDTYFPSGSPKHLLSQLLPPAPSSLGRMNNVVVLKATVWIRLHPNPVEGGEGGIKASIKSRGRPGTGGGISSTIRPFGRGRPGTSTGPHDPPPPLPKSGTYGSEENHYPAVWKKMDLVLTSFTYDGTSKEKGGLKKLKYHTRGTSTGPERTVSHLHLFDPSHEPPPFGSKAPLPVKRPKTSDTFGPGNTYGPDGEIIERQRRPLTFGVKVVRGQVVDLGDRKKMELDMTVEMQKRTKLGVIWFGWGMKEGWFVQFSDPEEINTWLTTVREILRRKGREQMTLQSRHFDRVMPNMYKPERDYHTENIEAAVERLRTPEEHISYYLSRGHSIWDKRTNPNLRIPSPGVSPPKLSRWARYEHPDMRSYRERDKLETFDQLAFGRVGWREWVWPVPPDKTKIGASEKSGKRAEGRRKRKKKLKLSQARRKVPGSTGKEGVRRIIPESRRAVRESTLSTLASDASILESQLGSTLPYLSPPLRSTPPGVHLTPSPPSKFDDTPNIFPVAQPSPLRPLLLASKSNRSLISNLPRQPSDRSIDTTSTPSTSSLRPSASASNTALGSTYSLGSTSGNTIRSTSTFGPTRNRPGTGGSGRNIPPPSLPPPNIPIPPTPSSRSSAVSGQRSRTVSESDKTPRKQVLSKFPTPPSSATEAQISLTPSKIRSKPPSSFPSGMIGATPISTPTQPSTPPQSTRGTGTPTIATPTGFAWAYQASTPAPVPAAVERGRELGIGTMGESTASLISEGGGSLAGGGSGSLLSVQGAAGRRRRARAAAVDLAGEIKEIDDARLVQIRAAEAAAADAEDPIDETRSRTIRFA